MSNAIVFKFSCGHVGRTNDSYLSHTSAFIRVAEIRYAPEIPTPAVCPDCKKSS